MSRSLPALARIRSPFLGWSVPLQSTLRAATALCAILASGCVWSGYTPNPDPPQPVATLEAPEFTDMNPGSTEAGHLDCPAGQCEAKYRIHVQRDGHLTVRVVPTAAYVPSDQVGFRATLGDSIGRILDQQRFDEERKKVVLKQDVRAGFYFVMVQAIGGGVDYKVQPSLR